MREVSGGQVLGRVFWDIPYVGYPIAYAKTQTGFIVLIVIPATLLVYSELQNIKREVQKKIAMKKENNNPDLIEKDSL